MRTHAATGPRTGGTPSARSDAHDHPLLALQRAAGNAAVARLLTSPRFAEEPRLEACAADRDRLRPGDRGDPVRRVQQALADLERGYDLGKGGADGKYGPRTAAVVRRFKTDEELGSTALGDVGPKTMRRLDTLFTATGPTRLPTPLPPGPVKLPFTELLGSVRLLEARPPSVREGGFRGLSRVEADIVPSPRQRFAEYRQLIRGSVFAGPAKDRRVRLLGPGAGDREHVSPTEFKADNNGDPAAGYGHRDRIIPGLFDEYSRPDRLTGVHYANEDTPGFLKISATEHLRVDLEFKGMLVDTRRDHPGEPETPINRAETTWRIQGDFDPPPRP